MPLFFPASSLIITDLSFRDPTTLVCSSTGRPVDSVTWLKNGATINTATTNFATAQSLTNPLQGGYENVLTSQQASDFVGTFTCRLTDAEGTSTNRNLIVNGEQIKKIHDNLEAREGYFRPLN